MTPPSARCAGLNLEVSPGAIVPEEDMRATMSVGLLHECPHLSPTRPALLGVDSSNTSAVATRARNWSRSAGWRRSSMIERLPRLYCQKNRERSGSSRSS